MLTFQPEPNMKNLRLLNSLTFPSPQFRRGVVLVMAAFMMIVVFGFAALSVDVGFMVLIRDQMQNASDATALAAAGQLASGYGVGASITPNQAIAAAQDAASEVAAANRLSDRKTVYLNVGRDLSIGHRSYNSATRTWSYQWGVQPYDCAKADIRRDQLSQNGTVIPDGQLKLYFARVFGKKTSSCRTTAIAAMKPAVGLRLAPGSSSSTTLKILPIALDQATWANLVANQGGFVDKYSYDPETGLVTAGSDGVLEVNIYPYGSSNLPPGNRGTVDIGSPNNSTSDLSRQIRYGQNTYDMSFFPNSELRFDNGPMVFNGDTGISAGIKDDLASIIGQPRAMPLFTSVAGPGNNAMYTVPKLVGVRIVYVSLTGSPSQKQVIVQPATYVTSQAITNNTTEASIDSIFSPPRLVQ
jgi:hypothetical protein